MKHKKILLLIGGIIALSILACSILSSTTGEPTFSGKEAEVEKAFENQVNPDLINLQRGEYYELRDVQVEGDWAFGEGLLLSSLTGGKAVAPGGTIFIFHKEGGEWKMATPGTDLYRSWLEQVPTSLMPEDLKMFLR